VDGIGGASVLIEDASGTLYGSTQAGGGPDNGGTVFKISSDGTETVLHSFCVDSDCSDGSRPNSVILGSDGTIYGTTFGGGNDFAGTVFTISPIGEFNTLYLFSSQSQGGDAHPSNPYAGLLQGSDGNFYGTTYVSNTSAGTIYSITPAGTVTLLHNFANSEGEFLQSPLIQGTDGDFYGTAAMGGDTSCGGPPDFGCGTVFSLTSSQGGKKAATSTVLSSSVNPSTYHQVVELRASVSSHSKGVTQGSVTLRSGTTALGTAALNSAGQAVFRLATLPRGSHPITAAYAGDNRHLSSRSAPLMQTVR
jgi:uncharacterized repeat protein (TIGR03803 family)